MQCKVNQFKIVFMIFISMSIMLLFQASHAQMVITTNNTPQQLVNVLVGNGIQVSNVTTNSATSAQNMGIFSNGGNTNIGLNSGIILASGTATNALGPNNSGSAGNQTNTGGDPQLATLIPGYTIYDAAVLEFDFVPLADSLTFKYVFGSEEYPEYVNSSYNDVFGFFISGSNPSGGTYTNQNIAIVPGTSVPVSINNVHNVGAGSYSQYYIDNTGGATIQYDGFTVVMQAIAIVVPCQTYHIKLAISDAGDGILDSGVFLEENSFSSNAIQVSTSYSTPNAGTTAIEGCNDAIITFSLPYPPSDTTWVAFTVGGTATNGVDYPQLPDSVPIVPGQYNASVTIAPVYDGITEGQETVTLVVQTSPCTTTSITVPINDYTPKIINVSPDTMVCQGTAFLLADASGGAPPYFYDWSPGSSLNDSSIFNPQATPASTTSYVVEVYDSTGCPSVFDTVNVEVNPKPNPAFGATPFAGCAPHTVDFVDYSTPNIVAWLWDFGDGNTSTQQNPTHIYQYPGSYSISLTVTTNKGCVETFAQSNLITVHAQPVADFFAVPEIAPLNSSTIQFTDQTTNAGSWQWQFGSEGSSADENPTWTFSTVGYHQVCLTASTPAGCVDSVCHKVLIINDSLVFPNVFTPNNDGVNDFFVIKNLENYLSNNLVVFNRWGKKVYEQVNYNNDWDGGNLADGVYFYVLEYHGYLRDGTEEGSLTIIR